MIAAGLVDGNLRTAPKRNILGGYSAQIHKITMQTPTIVASKKKKVFSFAPHPTRRRLLQPTVSRWAMEIGKGWNGQKAVWRGSLCRSDGKITVGVCAREKKARSKHMEAITSRLNREKFEVDCVCFLQYYREHRVCRASQSLIYHR